MEYLGQQQSGDKSVEENIQILRDACLHPSRNRGMWGIQGLKRLARVFKIMDDSGNRALNFQEFTKGLRDYGCSFSESETRAIFVTYDTDGTGSMNFDEFIQALQPTMSATREEAVRNAFMKMDSSGNGFISMDEIKAHYNVSEFFKDKSGMMTEDDELKEFMSSFESPDEPETDHGISFEEFMMYYRKLSASIDNDEYFIKMVEDSWKMEKSPVKAAEAWDMGKSGF